MTSLHCGLKEDCVEIERWRKTIRVTPYAVFSVSQSRVHGNGIKETSQILPRQAADVEKEDRRWLGPRARFAVELAQRIHAR